MAQITKAVNKTTVNGSEVFVYTFNISYSGLSQPAQNGYLVDFFPSKILVTPPQIGGPIQSITQTAVPGGRNFQFNFGPVSAGTSFSFTVVCSFGPGRTNNDSFTNSAELFADGLSVATVSAPTVNLVLTPQFNMLKSTLEPGMVRPGDARTLILTILNTGDLGYRINNVVISDALPAGLVPDLTFTPIGEDTPVNNYSDPATDGLTGSWSGNTMNFTLPSYSGGNYRITFKVKVAANVTPGQLISNIANWSINGVAQQPAALTLFVFSPANAFSLGKNATKSGYSGNPGSPILYNVSSQNQDNIVHTNFVLEDAIPSQVDITSIRFTSTASAVPSYNILYSLRSAPNTFLPLITGGSGSLSATPIPVPPGNGVSKVRVTAATVAPGSTSSMILSLSGNVNTTATNGQVLTNTATLTADSGISVSASANTTINGESDLSAVKTLTPNQQGFFPLDVIQFTVTATAANISILVNPTLSDLLPTGLIFLSGSEYFVYRDNFNNITYDSRNPGFPITIPSTEVVPNFAGTGNTLYRWKFTNFTLPKNNTLSVNFSTLVEVNPPPSFVNQTFVGNPGNNIGTVLTAITDTNDYDGDGITNEQISRASVSGGFLTTSEFSLKKLVKGDLNADYAATGSTIAGGRSNYQLQITNNQNIDLRDLQIVDILPYVGDTGVMLYTTPRLSQFQVNATGVVTAQVISLIGNPVDPNPDITIEYSTSENPIRFDSAGNPIGTGTWLATPPADITTLRSIQVITGSGFILRPYDRLIITVNANAAVGAAMGLTAYNSFAVRANKIVSGELEPMLPTEPNKVPVTIAAATGGSIGQFVWEDLNGNGIFDPGEPGINGVTVQLYDANMNLLATTVTADNASSQPGFYAFNNLPAGNYFVKFTPLAPYTLTVQQATAVGGSRPDPTTKLTDMITLTLNQTINEVNAGVVQPYGSIGQFVWEDLNGNGIYDPGEPGINGVTVQLYDANMNLLATTVTADNASNQPGYYAFNNLPEGNYFVKFTPLAPYTLTVQQAMAIGGSRPDPTTGRTNVITLSSGKIITDVNAGLLAPCLPPVINATSKCLHVGDTFVPMAGVTAFDCQGNDITADIIITENTVNTALPGLYHVTYSVTDSQEQTTTKLIEVFVCQNSLRNQAISDLIASIGLQQAALAHIINAEGEKIQKAVALNFSFDNMLKINASVASMTKNITKLQMVLRSKLNLFECSLCSGDCCNNIILED